MTEPIEEFLGELRLGRELISTSQVIAIGLITLFGLVFLLAERPIRLLGTRAPLAGFLVFVALGFTLLSIIELLGGSGERGGTYLLTHETLGGVGSFIAGWTILAGSLTGGVALIFVAVELFSKTFSLADNVEIGLAFALVVVLLLVQLFQAQPRILTRQAQALLLTSGLLLVMVAGVTQFNPLRLQFQPSLTLGKFLNAVSWMSVCYVAFEAILAARRQIRGPATIQPRAIVGDIGRRRHPIPDYLWIAWTFRPTVVGNQLPGFSNGSQ